VHSFVPEAGGISADRWQLFVVRRTEFSEIDARRRSSSPRFSRSAISAMPLYLPLKKSFGRAFLRLAR